MHILYSSMASKEMNMKFLGAGCSRMAYSVGDGICLKVPIKERSEVGIWQTQLSVVIQNDKLEVGKNVLEFNLDGSLIKNFHAGHDVVKIKHFELT